MSAGKRSKFSVSLFSSPWWKNVLLRFIIFTITVCDTENHKIVRELLYILKEPGFLLPPNFSPPVHTHTLLFRAILTMSCKHNPLSIHVENVHFFICVNAEALFYKHCSIGRVGWGVNLTLGVHVMPDCVFCISSVIEHQNRNIYTSTLFCYSPYPKEHTICV